MKVIRFEAENFKRLKAVEITPSESVVVVSGANGSGKSSVLDAIFAALAGKSAAPDMPIRKGEESARVTLDMGEIIVTRKWNGAGTSLVVESANGARFPSPQTMLDKLVGSLSFDPLEFTRLKPVDQRAALGKLAGVDEQLRTLDVQIAAAYENRSTINRMVKAKAGELAAIPETEAVEPVDVADLMDTIAADEAANRDTAERQQRRIAFTTETERVRGSAAERREQAARMIAEAEGYEQLVASREATAAQWAPLPDVKDVAPLKQRIVDAQQINAAVQKHARRAQLVLEHAALEADSQRLTDEIEVVQMEKAAIIADAPLPLEGLGFAPDGITYNGVPFDQASGAEQLRISVAIAMAANPQLRVLRVKDGSLLDEASLALLQTMATAQDYQVWIEVVDTSGTVGVVMQDGAVVDAHEHLTGVAA